MKCKICGMNHPITYHLKDTIKEKGYPTDSKRYHNAHVAADKGEKKNYPKGYQRLKKLDNTKVGPKELIGKHTKSGTIEVSKKVPKRDRAEVVYHEVVEKRKMNKRKK